MKALDCKSLLRNTSKDVPNAKNQRWTYQDEKHHSNNLMYQQHQAPFNMY